MKNPNTKILLVGSVPLENEEAVFRLTAEHLGARIIAMPDGETGPRTNWIVWQKNVMEQTPFLKQVDWGDTYGNVQADIFALRPQFQDEKKFAALGYAHAAIASFETFRRLKKDGVIDRSVRFLVALPTPLAPLCSFVAAADFFAVEPLYKNAMRAEIDAICAAIPADQLAFQWDTALEFALLEKVFPGPAAFSETDIVERLTELAGWVPRTIPLGYHFCYGDAGHHHFKEPHDTALMTRIANQLFDAVSRRIDWLHLPVPVARDDVAYFAPLAALKRPVETDLVLGLIHRTDGLEGAKRRIAQARRYAGVFGVATECGWGRRPRDTIADLMALNAQVAAWVDETARP